MANKISKSQNPNIKLNDAKWIGDEAGRYENDAALNALDALYRRGPRAEATHWAQAQLKRRLAEMENDAVWYGSVADTALGQVFYAATIDGLVAVEWGMSEREFLRRVGSRYGAQIVNDPDRLKPFGAQLREYLAGKRAAFDLPLDLRRLPEFQRTVLKAALKIPRGQVKTYGELARQIGRPRAPRAVGQALGHNPMPIVIPCHRVVGSDGSLHGYGGGGGLKTKAWLLQLEGARLSPLTTR